MAATQTNYRLLRGTTSFIATVRIEDSAATTGAGKTGLVFNTGSPKCYYSVDGGAATAMTLVTMTAGTWTSLGFIEVDATNMPGVYQIGIPNAALATGTFVDLELTGMTGASPVHIRFHLIAKNDQAAVTQWGAPV